MADHSIRIVIDSRDAEAGGKRVEKSLLGVKSAADKAAGKPIRFGFDAADAELT